MAKEKNEKTPFWSKYGAEWITSAAYLAEEMCARKAWSLDKKTLPPSFGTLVNTGKENFRLKLPMLRGSSRNIVSKTS
jgi:hypothetical protein